MDPGLDTGLNSGLNSGLDSEPIFFSYLKFHRRVKLMNPIIKWQEEGQGVEAETLGETIESGPMCITGLFQIKPW